MVRYWSSILTLYIHKAVREYGRVNAVNIRRYLPSFLLWVIEGPLSAKWLEDGTPSLNRNHDAAANELLEGVCVPRHGHYRAY
jgi:hypothetical protein